MAKRWPEAVMHSWGSYFVLVPKLADKLKKKYSLEEDVEAIFSLSNFFILEPNNK